MILSFSVENFRSIKERQELILTPSSKDSSSDKNIIQNEHTSALKGVAIYGANASGKSNVLNGLMRMREIVMTSASKSLDEAMLPAEPFKLNTTTRELPSVFEVEMIIGDLKYRYGFAVTQKAIVEEWLYSRARKAKEAKLFFREAQNFDINSRKLPGVSAFTKKTRDDVLFLRTCAEWNDPIGTKIVEWFRSLRQLSGLADMGFFGFTAERLQDEGHASKLLEFARRADLNICNLSSTINEITEADLPSDMPASVKKQVLSNKPIEPKIKTEHLIYDDDDNIAGLEEFDLENEESEGTRKFIAMSGPLHHTMEEGSILVIDELEARLHPKLTKAIVKWFFGPSNTKGAQLIFATHEIGIMVPEILRRDQIWFCEKDGGGATSLYSLDEFDSSKVRSNTRFNKQYLQGIFGAVPNLAINE